MYDTTNSMIDHTMINLNIQINMLKIWFENLSKINDIEMRFKPSL